MKIVGVLSLRTSIVLAPLRRWRPPLRVTPTQSQGLRAEWP